MFILKQLSTDHQFQHGNPLAVCKFGSLNKRSSQSFFCIVIAKKLELNVEQNWETN